MQIRRFCAGRATREARRLPLRRRPRQVFVRCPAYITLTGDYRGRVSANVHFKGYLRECARYRLAGTSKNMTTTTETVLSTPIVRKPAEENGEKPQQRSAEAALTRRRVVRRTLTIIRVK